MAEDDTLTKALVDVRARRTALQNDHDRIVAELAKLRAAEAALTSIVEDVPLDDAVALHPYEGGRTSGGERASPVTGARRGARGPRANSAKGRLKALLGGTGPQGLSHAEIAERLPDVAPNTLNTYLSMMVTGGEAVRNGDFFTAPELVSAEAASGAEDDAAEEVDASPDA